MGILKELAKSLPHPILLRVNDAWQRRTVDRREDEVRKKAGIPLLEADALMRVKASDTVFILGSGPSINQIGAERWQAITEHDTIGLNFWPFHPFVPKIYFFENRPCDRTRETVDDKVGTTFVDLFRRRGEDYAQTVKVIMDLLHPEPNIISELPEPIRQNLYSAYTVTPVARNANEFRSALKSVARSGMFSPQSPFASLLKYNGTITTLITLAAKMQYRRIVLCGVDMRAQAYFWQDPALYPETKDLEFSARNAPHHTATSNPWMLPMDAVLELMQRVVLEPAAIKLYVENRGSALYPMVPEAPAELFETAAVRGSH